jgi:hypothetical protein
VKQRDDSSVRAVVDIGCREDIERERISRIRAHPAEEYRLKGSV